MDRLCDIKIRISFGNTFRLILAICMFLVLLPVPTRAATNIYSSPVYGFDVEWENTWRPSKTIVESGDDVIDGAAFTWGVSITATYVGFMSDASTLEGITSEYLMKYLMLDGIVNIVETAGELADGTLTPTVVDFPGGSGGVRTLLAIYPYKLPIHGTAFVEAWVFPENLRTAQLDRAYEDISFELPQTVAEQGTYPSRNAITSNQTPGSEECAGYEAWRNSIASIYDRMVDAIEDLRGSTSLPGLWFQATLNMAYETISNLSDELLRLDELAMGFDAMDFLSLALSNYGSALRNLDSQIDGTLPQNPQLIQSQMALGDQHALAFASEILSLDSECGI